MAERRISERVQVLDDFPVTEQTTGDLLGHVGNLSLHGMLIISACRLEVGRLYRLTIRVPKPIQGRNQLHMTAMCRWSAKDKESNITRTGFQFGNLNSDDELMIRRLQADYAFSTSDNGLIG